MSTSMECEEHTRLSQLEVLVNATAQRLAKARTWAGEVTQRLERPAGASDDASEDGWPEGF